MILADAPPRNPVRAFEAAGRLMSISRAAMELHVAPAAVSRQVRALEEYLGVRLFTREHRAIRLTSAGELYLKELTTHLAGIRNATANIMETKGRKVLKIRAYTTFAMRWLIPRLSSFHTANPDIDVKLTTSLEWVDFEREDVDAATYYLVFPVARSRTPELEVFRDWLKSQLQQSGL